MINDQTTAEQIAMAQVYATLAVADAIRDLADRMPRESPPEPDGPWVELPPDTFEVRPVPLAPGPGPDAQERS